MEEKFQSICEEFVSDLMQSNDVFKALYRKEIDKFPDGEQEEIIKKNEELQKRIIDFYKKSKNILQH
jgi:hypothetical protein